MVKDIGRKRGRNFELSEQESRKKQKNEYDIFFPKETYCNKKGKIQRVIFPIQKFLSF